MAKSKKTVAEDGGATATASTKPKTFQVFERLTVRRSLLHFHEENPRSIDKHSFRKLRDFIKKHGLLNALVVNRRTVANGFDESEAGKLVICGGHQRCRACDAIRDYPAGGEAADYDVPVDVIEVSASKERAYLVALNNAGMMGSWDHDILEQVAIAIASDPEGNIADTGFERADLGVLFDEGVLDEIFGVDPQVAAQVEAQAPTLEMLEEIRLAGKTAKGERSGSEDRHHPPDSSAAAGGEDGGAGEGGGEDDPAGDGDAVDPSDPPDSEAAAGDSAELARMKRERTAYRERVAEQNESEFMLVLVAENEAELNRWMLRHRLPREKRYLSLAEFCSKTGLEIDQE